MRLNVSYDSKLNREIVSKIDLVKAHVVDISSYMKAAKAWGNKAATFKVNNPEDRLILDSYKDYERRENGLLGERAVEKFLDIKFVDLTLGTSGKYKKPDLSTIGIDCGVKSAMLGNMPLIKPFESKWQIIVLIDKEHELAHIMGVAKPTLFFKYTKAELVKDADALRDGKLGFFGYDELIQFENLNDLQLTIN